METLQALSLEELFGQFDQLVKDRPYLSEEDGLEELFSQFDQFVEARPYLSE